MSKLSTATGRPTNVLLTKFGNPAPATQQIVQHDDGILFTSYGHPIALRHLDGEVTLFPHWNASQTTTFYRNQFLGENTGATRAKLATGDYRFSR